MNAETCNTDGKEGRRRVHRGRMEEREEGSEKRKKEGRAQRKGRFSDATAYSGYLGGGAEGGNCLRTFRREGEREWLRNFPQEHLS